MDEALTALSILLFLCAMTVESAAGAHRLRFVDQSGKPIPDVTIYYSFTAMFPGPGAPGMSGAIRSDADGRAEVDHPCAIASGSCCSLVSAVSYSVNKPGYIFTPATGSVPCQMESMDITVVGVGSELPALAAVSAASYAAPLSSEMLVALFGQNLSSASDAASTLPLPASLAGISVIIKDSLQVERPGSLLFVSPAQINLVMPAGVAPGSAMVMVKDEGNNIRDLGFATMTSISPGVFTANANGRGVPAGAVVRVKPGNVQSYEAILAFDQSQGAYVPIPVDLGPDTDVVVLVLFGTGWRNATSPSNVSVKISDVDCPVEFVGKQPTMEGLDQLNVRLPRTLIGKGDALVQVNVDGKLANVVEIKIK